MKNLRTLFSFTILLILISGSGTTISADIDAETENDTTTVTTDALVVEIKGGGNVPFFFFWQPGEESVKYKLQMDQIFEAVDNSSDPNGVYDNGIDRKVSGSSLSLSALLWSFTDIMETRDEAGAITNLDFNLTSTSDEIDLQLNIHLSSSQEASLKFDVIIDGYEFKDDNAMLILAFKLLNEGTSDETTGEGDTVTFGDGFFQSESFAEDADGSLNVGLSHGSEDDNGEASSKIYLAYEHFSGKMVHDPTIGIGDPKTTVDIGSTEDTDQESTEGKDLLPDLSKASLIAPTIIATAAFIAIPIGIYWLRRKS